MSLSFRLIDGGMGTQLIARGLTLGTPTASWNLTHPEQVREVHAAYAAAGSQAITTNTFGAGHYQLALHGLAGEMEAINRAAAAIVREAAPGLPILGDIGPSGQMVEPYGEVSAEELQEQVARQGEVLAEAGVSAFLVETFSDPAELALTVHALLPFRLPIIATYAFENRGGEIRTSWGASPEEAGAMALQHGATVIGANCGTSLSLEDYLALAESFRAAHPGGLLLFQPNAGTPQETVEGWEYEADAEAFAAWASTMRRGGDVILGGCCGTAPRHIALMAAVRP